MIELRSPSQRPGMGSILRDDGWCTFRVWAPNASSVRVFGDFNGWAQDTNSQDVIWMFHEGGGFWSVEVRGVQAYQQYRLIINNNGHGPFNHGGTHYRLDPRSLDISHSGGNSIVVPKDREVGETDLAGDPFSTPSIDNLICYQVHVGTFRGKGDGVDTSPDGVASFTDLADHLDHIRGLGFNAICLLPEAENPGDRSAGYAPAHFFSPESAFGTPWELRRLVKRAHEKGVAVIFDVVYNHYAPSDNSVWQYDGNTEADGGIYVQKPDTPWGARPAHWRREVRDFFLDHLRMLFDDYRIDGVRLDAVQEISDQTLRHLFGGIRSNPFWHNKIFIAEWSGGRDILHFAVTNIGFDAVWSMGDRGDVRDALSDFGNADTDSRVDHLLRTLDSHGFPRPSNFVRYFLGSHDDHWDEKSGGEPQHRFFVEMMGGRGNWHARAKSRLAWALNVFVPGTPMLFMGNEFNQWGYWTPGPDNNPIDPDHRLDWSLTRHWQGEQMLRLVHAVNTLRFEKQALRAYGFAITNVSHSDGIIAFRRWNNDGGVVLIVVNITDQTWDDYGIHSGVPQANWREIFNSDGSEFGGDGQGNFGGIKQSWSDGRVFVTVPRWSVLLFELF